MKDLSSYAFSPLRDGDLALYRGCGSGLPPILLVTAENSSLGALRQVHARGLVHKDIKPANVLVDPCSGGVWLTGFGIASRLPRERLNPEAPEVIAGTLAYMAPEQTGRMNRSIDARSDLYSLGIAFYEILTGRLPFPASSIGTQTTSFRKDHLRLSTHRRL